MQAEPVPSIAIEPRPKLRILLVSNMFPPDADGGLEVNAEKVATGLRTRGHDVTVLTSRFRGEYAGPNEHRPWVVRALDLAAPQSALPQGGSKLALASMFARETTCHRRNLSVAKRHLAEREYDVAYTFGLSRIGPALMAAVQERGIPILWHQGGSYLEDRWTQWTGASRIALLFRKMLPEELSLRYEHLAFVSRFLLEKSREVGFAGFEGRGAGTLAVIPRGIEFDLGEDIERERTRPPVLLMAARIVPHKGMHVAIEAIELLRKRRPDLEWRLEIAGSADDADVMEGIGGTSYMKSLSDKVAGAGLGERVSFLGPLLRSELQAKMRAATAFISASTYGEPFANTIIEALAAGTPLIVSAAGSSQEVVRDGESALVYEMHDADALSRHIERVICDKVLALSLAGAGLQVIERRFTMDRILDQTEELLGRIATSSGGSA